MLDAQPLAMQTGKGYLAGIVLRAVVERHSQRNAILLVI